MAIPNWWDQQSVAREYYDPTSGQTSALAEEGYMPVYVDPGYTGSVDYSQLGTADYLYSPDYAYPEPPVDPDAPTAPVNPDYWWTGTEAIAGTEAGQEGYIPISVGDTYNDQYSNWLNPDYESILPLDMRIQYGITYGDAYTTPPDDGVIDDGGVTYDPWTDANLQDTTLLGQNRDGYEWTFNPDLGRWNEELTPIDTSVPSTVWDAMDANINAWRDTFSGLLSQLDLDFSDQQTILDTLTSRILDYESPDLTAMYGDMDSLISQIEGLGDNPDIDRVLGLLEAGPDQNEAFDFVAKSFGFSSSTEYFDWLAEQRGLTRADMEGLTDDEKAEYDKIMRMDMADAERRSQAQMEAVFANTGSAIQYMSAADEANSQMVNMQMQYRTEQMNQDIMLQSQALDQQMQQYMGMVQQGQMSALQYMDMQQSGFESLLNGYLGQASMEMQSLMGALEGQQGLAGLMLTESAQDLEAMNSQFESVYNSMMTQTGINTSVLETLNLAYDTSMKPLLDSINTLLAQENLSAQDAALALEKQALLLEETMAATEAELGGWGVFTDAIDAVLPDSLSIFA